VRYYKLAPSVISVGALGNKVFHCDDNGTYPETSWKTGEAEELVSKGFLVEVKPEEESKDEKPADEIKPDPVPEKKENEVIHPITLEPEKKQDEKEKEISPIRSIDDIDIKELRLHLIGKKIPFDQNSSKLDLYKKYVESLK
jgi:hypothetical protein